MLKIVHAPAPILTKGVREVKKIDKKIRELVYDMEETLIEQIDPQGVGLAAPQINEDLAIFIIKPTLKAETLVFINPKILETKQVPSPASQTEKEKDKEEDIKLEGCLSIPRIWGPVSRNTKVLLEYQDLTGERHTEWFSGFKAVIIQHEMDHLSGILFTERVLEQKGKLYQEKDGELEKIEG
ncbi:MAG: peptide deformylase [Candidatus Roizmanbacteria bacterium]|nr:peptide deformylase [Candidatus Roizmanbacteria bacterium]